MTKPRISIIRLSDRAVVESLTLKNARGKVFRAELTRAYARAEKLSINGEQHGVVVDRMLGNVAI